MRRLGLDLGEKRIGVSLSDVEGILARPLVVVHRRSKQNDFEAIARLVQEWAVEQVVVGLPQSLEGEIGPQARWVKRYARELAHVLDVPIVYFDESYSTVEADELLRAGGRPHRRRREMIDAAAAAVILQGYLDSQREPLQNR